ncbi:hypothetical protein LEL_07039 [Akanthomyces lecanii RCEF 1005]|uniref:Uncharacterized protein n=1 Tax=Akanthomyces lecanii RCEF 1005 TaxID=1081108 RepID=A0A168FDY3_CORDF|nr:hypothetical protein LEL_07039 [Akanthomyces lecanii RCEF 1005]
MKLLTLTSGILALASGTEACIRVHAYLHNDPVVGDGMKIQIYEGHRRICNTGAHKYLASDQTKWNVKCEGDNFEVELTDDGKKGTVRKHSIDYKTDLDAKETKHKVECTYKTGQNERCAGYTSWTETTLVDKGGDCDEEFSMKNCGSPECDLTEKDKTPAKPVKPKQGLKEPKQGTPKGERRHRRF